MPKPTMAPTVPMDADCKIRAVVVVVVVVVVHP